MTQDPNNPDPAAPAPTPAPTPPPEPKSQPDYATRAELNEVRTQMQAGVRAMEGITSELRETREEIKRDLAAAREVPAPQPPPPPQAVAQREGEPGAAPAEKPKLQFREPYT